MKKSVFILFILPFVLAACSGDHQNEPDIVDVPDIEFNYDEIFEEYFGEWGYEDVSDSETYHLLENLLDSLLENFMPPKYIGNGSSYYFSLFPTEFNNFLRNNEKATAFFKREDCVYFLMSTYLTNLKMELHWDFRGYDAWRNYFFEILMSSDMFMSEMNVTEKNQMMVMALEGYKAYEEDKNVARFPFTIMISIMLSSNYPPFVKDVKPMLIEQGFCGYGLKSNDSFDVPGRDDHATDLITGYAKKFINDNKK